MNLEKIAGSSAQLQMGQFHRVSRRGVGRLHRLTIAVSSAAFLAVFSVDAAQGAITVINRGSIASASFGGDIRLVAGGAAFFNHAGLSEEFTELTAPYSIDYQDNASISRGGFTLRSDVAVQQYTVLMENDGNLVTVSGSFFASVQTTTSGDPAVLRSATNESDAATNFGLALLLDTPAELSINGMMSLGRTPGPLEFDVGGYIAAAFGFVGGVNHWEIVLDQTTPQAMAPINVSARLPAGNYNLEASAVVALFGSDPILADATSRLEFNMTLSALAPEYRWNNPAGGSYSVAENWDPQGVPGTLTTALVDLDGTYTISLSENVENEQFIVGGDGASARPNLNLGGHRLRTKDLLVNPGGLLNIDGAARGSHIEADLVRVAANTLLAGDAWFRQRPGANLTFENEGFLQLGPSGQASPQRTHFMRVGDGPEPEEFLAHLVVRGDFEQKATGRMVVTLNAHKAINQGADFEENAPLPSAELFVTGSAVLNGSLDVSLSSGYQPKHNDSFSIIRGPVTLPFDPARIQLPTVELNNLPLVPIQTPTGIHAVVPQKVVLAWGHDLPVSLDPVDVFGFTLLNENPLGSEDAFAPRPEDVAAFETFKATLLPRVQQHYNDSGVEGIVFTAGPPEENAINLYFIDPKDSPTEGLLGRAYTGIDRLNRDADGEAVIVVRGFNRANPTDVETEAETMVHEIGHLLGLRHIDPPGAISIMDYDDDRGDFELFSDGVFNIWEPPGDPAGTVFPDTHNPSYHLQRYIDGVPHEDLVAIGTLPGTWDLPGPVLEDLLAGFEFRIAEGSESETGDVTLYDVLVFKTEGDPNDLIDKLAEFDQITLEMLAAESFPLNGGEGLGLIAASQPGGPYDVALAIGDPFQANSLVLYPSLGELHGFLQLETVDAAGYRTLAVVDVDVTVVPEPAGLVLLSCGLAFAIVPGRRR